MTLGGWYAAYQVVHFSLTVANELARANDLTGIGPRAQTTIVLDRQGHPAFSFYAEQRIDVTLDQVSRHMVDAIIAVEDRRFYSHCGLDPVRIVGAAVRNVRAGGIREGGSTITQQLARAVRLSPARTFERKVREAMLALRLEQRYSKERILQEYLNTVYFGDGYYGVEAAARGYFGKNASALTPPEAALLAAVVRAPSRDVPSTSPERALRRRNLVLRLMRSQNRISEAELSAGLAEPLANRTNEDRRHLRASGGGGEYFQEDVRLQLLAVLGQERMRQGGFRVYSTYEPALQRAAELAIRTRVAEIAQEPSPCARSPGQSGRHRSGERRRARARRRKEFLREPVQPCDAGPAPAGIGIQADHLCRGARAGLRTRLDASRPRHAHRWLRGGVVARR